MKIEIKDRTNEVLFSHECEDNSIHKTLKEGLIKGANLKDANLEGAYLEGAYLKDANLEGAYLEGAYLEGAYLEGAYLKGAYLKGANLKGAYLKGAYLEGAYLEGANLYQIVGIGSASRCTTFDVLNNKVICGCFYGSLEEFEAKVKATHAGTIYELQYLAAIEFIKKIIEFNGQAKTI